MLIRCPNPTQSQKVTSNKKLHINELMYFFMFSHACQQNKTIKQNNKTNYNKTRNKVHCILFEFAHYLHHLYIYIYIHCMSRLFNTGLVENKVCNKLLK